MIAFRLGELGKVDDALGVLGVDCLVRDMMVSRQCKVDRGTKRNNRKRQMYSS